MMNEEVVYARKSSAHSKSDNMGGRQKGVKPSFCVVE
jgi:hypothetical protein